MELIALGISFRTSSLAERERWSIAADRVPDFLNGILALPQIAGIVYLATCNRVELYVSAATEAADSLMSYWRHFVGLQPDAKLPTYVHRREEAFCHLLRVASGLDSLVLGEPEIFGQVKEAYAVALENGVAGPLNFVFQKAFRVAKQIRSETGIARHPVSVSSVALMLAQQVFGNFNELTALVVGLGEMGVQTAELLQKRGVKKLLQANRTKNASHVYLLSELPELLLSSDLVVSCTAAPLPILTQTMLKTAIAKKEGPLVLIDLSVPRNIESSIGDLKYCYLYNVDDLKTIADKNLAFRKKEAELAEEMIDKTVASFSKEWERRVPNIHAIPVA